MAEQLTAPFPWFGGKRRVADLVWSRFGDTHNYVEPFAGSLAVLLGRPHVPRIETVNDLDCMIANFWRALAADPDQVAHYADHPVNEADLHARHRWIVNHARGEFRERVMTDPEHCDAQIAGWWVWGISAWIGDNWCRVDTVNAVPNLLRNRGVCRKLPDLGDYMAQLATRLRRVRVCCGDWSRVMTPTPTYHCGTTAVFLDPPYSDPRRDDVYNCDSRQVAHDVREWCITNQDNPKLRIALCGYDGEHDLPGWDCVAWTANGGYANAGTSGNANRRRERIWFSPHCVHPDAAALAGLPLELSRSCETITTPAERA